MIVSKAELDVQLQAWHAWAYEQGQGRQFSAHQLALYSGLKGKVKAFNRANMGQATSLRFAACGWTLPFVPGIVPSYCRSMVI